MATVNQEFQSAPMGRRICHAIAGVAALTLVVLVVQVAVGIGAWKIGALAFGTGWKNAGVAPIIGLMVGLMFMVLTFQHERSRVARFAIADNILVLGKKQYPLGGLIEVNRDPEILRWAFKTFGNGGLGAIRGKYWSKRVGCFDAFMTGTENAVVLRWPDKKVAVSPADPEFFITCAKSAAGLR